MAKEEKREGLPTPATQRRIDPPATPRKKPGHTRKVYPPHWEVARHSGLGWSRVTVYPHKFTGQVRDMPFFGMYEPKGRAWTLQEKLDHLAVLYPETASWPVRFL